MTGTQWWWKIRYASDDPSRILQTANEIHIPIGRPVSIRGNSDDVIHSFWVPSLQGKRDLIPGRPTLEWLEADRPGEYRGQCAEFCGLQHAHMAFWVIARAAGSIQRVAGPSTSACRRTLGRAEQARSRNISEERLRSLSHHSWNGRGCAGRSRSDAFRKPQDDCRRHSCQHERKSRWLDCRSAKYQAWDAHGHSADSAGGDAAADRLSGEFEMTPAASEQHAYADRRCSPANMEFQARPPWVVVGHQSSGNRAALHSDGVHLPVDRRH